VDGLFVLARLALAVPFAVGGLTKLGDPMGARRAVRTWGVPSSMVNGWVAGSTLVEIAVAVGLMVADSAWLAAVAAMGCLLLPVVCAAAEMARTGPSGATLSLAVRGMALAIPAAVVIGEGRAYAGPSLLPWLAGLSAGRQVAVLGAAAALAAVAWPIARRGARVVDDPPAPPEESSVRSEAPGAAPDGGRSVAVVPLVHPAPELTIGMATYDDFDGVYFTLQALRLFHDLDRTELLVVDNYGCSHTRDFVRGAGATYVLADDVVGTAPARDRVFGAAHGRAVLCCDSHVLFDQGVVARLRRFYRDHPACDDLLQGPMVYDDGVHVSTHFQPVWREQMWGIWATDPRGYDPDGDAFDIPMQGLGAFTCRGESWLGFHPGFRGFGGEEGYIHEKFRRAGRRCLCLPWLRWTHRFGRPRGVPYPLTVEDKLRNYLLGHTELGLDLTPVLTHFSRYLPEDRIARVAEEASPIRPASAGSGGEPKSS
jgi:uncharacterized membrane protein YphA (DoxX/SURF4 family)